MTSYYWIKRTAISINLDLISHYYSIRSCPDFFSSFPQIDQFFDILTLFRLENEFERKVKRQRRSKRGSDALGLTVCPLCLGTALRNHTKKKTLSCRSSCFHRRLSSNISLSSLLVRSCYVCVCVFDCNQTNSSMKKKRCTERIK